MVQPLGYGLDLRGFALQQRKGIFLFSKTSGGILGATHRRLFPRGLSDRGLRLTTPCSTRVNEWSYTYACPICLGTPVIRSCKNARFCLQFANAATCFCGDTFFLTYMAILQLIIRTFCLPFRHFKGEYFVALLYCVQGISPNG